MEEGEYYAIETFGSTGRGKVVEEVSVNLQAAGGGGNPDLESG